MMLFALFFCSLFAVGKAIDGMQTLPSYRAEVHSAGVDTYEDLTYHGGETLTQQNSISVYFLWYGDGWKQSDGSSIMDLVKGFVSSVSTSSWWGIVQSFGSSGSAQLSIAGEVQVSASTLSIDRSEATNQLSQVIGSGSGQFPNDPTAIYVLVPAYNIITTDGFCQDYCAYHTGIHDQSNILQFAFVGNPTQCLFNCSGLSITGRFLSPPPTGCVNRQTPRQGVHHNIIPITILI